MYMRAIQKIIEPFRELSQLNTGLNRAIAKQKARDVYSSSELQQYFVKLKLTLELYNIILITWGIIYLLGAEYHIIAVLSFLLYMLIKYAYLSIRLYRKIYRSYDFTPHFRYESRYESDQKLYDL